MSREIKFRLVFQNHGNEDDFDIVEYSIDELIFGIEGGNTAKEYAHLMEGWGYSLVDKLQFTGLHDKNGREIYEGDIVKLNNALESVGVVRRDNFEDTPGYYVMCPDGDVFTFSYLAEVIGNIHEHSELLEAGE